MSETLDTIDLSGDGATPRRTRDAANTRQLLLQAARVRFARDGYSATTVRDIASDARVNVALISRYFTSKEGLFEACLLRAAEDLDGPEELDVALEQIVQTMINQIAGSPTGDQPLQLLLLLRSSGDEGAERIRLNTFRIFAKKIAAAAGQESGASDLLLRAQLAVAIGLGITLLRSSTTLEPLASASMEELDGPIRDIVSALLDK